MSDDLLSSLLADRLAALEASSLRRVEKVPPPGQLVLCGNDYLGLSHSPVLAAAASRAALEIATGSGASRLVSGTSTEHLLLERELAEWLGTQAALVFSSGYAANVGLLSALLSEGDAVFSDALNHASLIDGIRLSRAERFVFPHRDLAVLERQLAECTASGMRVVVTESVFSMDGDLPDLAALCAVARRHRAVVIVDEAHALGVLGRGGRGLVEQAGVADDVAIRVGTFGKSFGSAGAFVAGSPVLREWLFNRARSFVFSTAPPPPVVAATRAALLLIRAGDAQALLGERMQQMATRLREVNLWRGDARSCVFPVIVGEADKALQLAARLGEHGYFVQAIRPPTVPAGSARLRITVSAAHTREQIDQFVSTLQRVIGELELSCTPSSHD